MNTNACAGTRSQRTCGSGGRTGETMIDDADWQRAVKRMLRAEMVRRGLSYEQLATGLGELGSKESLPNLRDKVARGRFTAAFLARCMVALGVTSLPVPRREQVTEDAAPARGVGPREGGLA